MNDRRTEPRSRVELAIRVWGIDATGALFVQDAVACNISVNGGLVSGIERKLRTGDVIGVGYADRQARYRVVWVRDSGSERKIQIAVHKLTGESCPWEACVATPLSLAQMPNSASRIAAKPV